MTDLSPLSIDDLVPINSALESKTTEEIISWTIDTFPRVALLTSGQQAGSVLAKIISKMGRILDLIFVDTGVLFSETLETLDRIKRTYNFPLKSYKPALDMAEQTEKYGVLYLNHAGQEQCCHMRKVEPLQGIHEDYEVLLGPLRRGEGGRRAKTPIVDLDTNLKVIRINPMANFPEAAYEALLQEEDTITNPLHSQGFPTIGCTRCTTPVREDESSRSGRWRHLSGVDYCGINPSDFLRKKAEIDFPSQLVEQLRQAFPAN